jgi:peptidoglycan/xylan/chitin deacetylase (PgdA/CDA1 family)
MIIRRIKNFVKPLLQIFTGNQIVWHQKNCSKTVYLTFDDGPHPVYTPMILDLLDNLNIKGTFFLVGEQVEKFPNLACEIVRRGHQIGSHSFYHSADLQKGISNYKLEINDCIETIFRATGRHTNLFRPPWGTISARLVAYCIKRGIIIILWSHDSLDCKKELHNIRLDVQDGDIVLLHDDAIYSANILVKEIPRLTAMGFTFDIIGSK